MGNKQKKSIQRVDKQVTIITAAILVVSFLCAYIVFYQITNEDMIYSLKERSNSIYDYVENYVDKTTFENTDDLRMESERYQIMKQKLEEVRQSTNVRYIYTATINAAGEYIYLVDGLPSDSSDFRFPGDPIEKEIIPEMKSAMGNQIMMPNEIKSTEWGKIFVTYFPIHDQGEVVGVLGIEFDAAHQYQAFQRVRYITFAIFAIACGCAALIAIRMFRRISNPMFKDLKNTDYLTNLKSRNAFEIDVKNLTNKEEQVGFIVVDLNDLKKVNDEQGHYIGDQYIVDVGKILMRAIKSHPIYRYGGDEFIVLCRNVSDENMIKHIEEIRKVEEEVRKETDTYLYLSLGYAVFDSTLDKNLEDTFKRADAKMYACKKDMKINQDV